MRYVQHRIPSEKNIFCLLNSVEACYCENLSLGLFIFYSHIAIMQLSFSTLYFGIILYLICKFHCLHLIARRYVIPYDLFLLCTSDLSKCEIHAEYLYVCAKTMHQTFYIEFEHTYTACIYVRSITQNQVYVQLYT